MKIKVFVRTIFLISLVIFLSSLLGGKLLRVVPGHLELSSIATSYSSDKVVFSTDYSYQIHDEEGYILISPDYIRVRTNDPSSFENSGLRCTILTETMADCYVDISDMLDLGYNTICKYKLNSSNEWKECRIEKERWGNAYIIIPSLQENTAYINIEIKGAVYSQEAENEVLSELGLAPQEATYEGAVIPTPTSETTTTPYQEQFPSMIIAIIKLVTIISGITTLILGAYLLIKQR